MPPIWFESASYFLRNMHYIWVLCPGWLNLCVCVAFVGKGMFLLMSFVYITWQCEKDIYATNIAKKCTGNNKNSKLLEKSDRKRNIVVKVWVKRTMQKDNVNMTRTYIAPHTHTHAVCMGVKEWEGEMVSFPCTLNGKNSKSTFDISSYKITNK